MAIISLLTMNIEQSEQNSFASRVEFLLDSRGCSKAWLANELGISKQALNHILRHGKKPKFVSEIALIFTVSPHWLETGEGNAQQQPNQLLSTIPLYNLTEVIEKQGINNILPIEKVFLKTENEHKHFAILFQNYPSMSSRFEENSILIFDENLSPQNGAYILAKSTTHSIVLRQFFIDGKKIILKPSNSDFETIQCENLDLLGTLIETRIKFQY